MPHDQEYVLGTGDEEIERLGLQHRVWREFMLAGWRRAGITMGASVVDLGAGPGFATTDLAEIVGLRGRVTAVELSARFESMIARAAERRMLSQIEIVRGDLMQLTPRAGHDFAWCRWVASFVPCRETLVRWVEAALRP